MTKNSYIIGFVAVLLLISGYFLFDSKSRLTDTATGTQAKSADSQKNQASRQFQATASKPKQTMPTRTEQKIPMQTALRKSTQTKKTTTTESRTADSGSTSIRSRSGPPSKRF